jgi:hypothetical protein
MSRISNTAGAALLDIGTAEAVFLLAIDLPALSAGGDRVTPDC